MDGRGLFRDFVGRSDNFDISRKGDGDENGPIYTLAGEESRVPATYGEGVRPEFEEQTEPNRAEISRFARNDKSRQIPRFATLARDDRVTRDI